MNWSDQLVIERTPGVGEAVGADRYEVGEEIARGGMGRVLAAVDRVLGRRVALKTVKVPVAGLHERFSREMRITARLQHPAIVPIYDAGVLPSGEPFYAMRMITGRSLDRAIAEADGLAGRLALLPAVIAVAEAIAYAHDEGVLHRDLKPQNVIVGPFGETVLLDWGLAKDRLAADPEPVGLALGSGTQAGEVLGTPAYMPPEQLAGEVVDERSDVYCLGGILYQLLCGVPPHEGPTVTGEVRPEQILPIAARQPDAPAELAAIAARALAPDPADRYPSAAALAGDVKRFQAGALVHAHRYTLGELARKWIARHRGAVAVAAVSLMCVVALSIVGVRRILHEKAQAQHERAQAQHERDRAEQQREAAEKLVGFVLHDLRGRLDKVGRIDVLAGVGAEVDAYYGTLPPRGGADLVRRAAALAVLGDARRAGGDVDAALAAYRRGLDAARAAGDDDATCRAHQRVADVLIARGDLDGAAAGYGACVAIARARLADAPLSAPGAWPFLLAGSLTELGAIARVRNDFPEATRLIEESLRAAEQVTGDDGVRVRIKATDDLASVALDRGEVDRAADLYVSNVAAARADAAAHPDDPDRRNTLATVLGQAGRGELRRGHAGAAEQAFVEARELAAALVDRDPANTDWLHMLAVTEDYLGWLETERGRTEAAIAHATASNDVSLRLYRMDPTNVKWARDVVAGEVSITDMLRALGRDGEARERMERALAVAEPLAAQNPDYLELTQTLGIALLHLGNLETAAGDRAGARATLERAATLMRSLLAHDDTPRARRDLAMSLLLLYDVPGDRVASRRHLEEALRLVEPLRPLAATDAETRDVIVQIDDAWGKL